MGGGLLSGLIWGSILSLMLVWVASQMSGMIEVMKAPQGVAMTAPDPVDVKPLKEDVAALAPAPDSPVGETVVDAAAPESSAADAAPVVDANPGPAPEAAETADGLTAPDPGQAPIVSAAVDDPIRPAAVALTPEAGSADAAPQVAALEPALGILQPVVVEPTAPEVPEIAMAALPDVDPAPATGAEYASPIAPDADDRPEVGSAPAAPSLEPEAESESEPAPEPEIATAPADQTGPRAQPEPAIVQPDGEAGPERSGTLEASGGLRDLAPNVKVNRLPTIGGTTEPPAPRVETNAEGEATGPAIARYAVPFENPDNRPVVAILLIDEGGARPNAAEIGALPFPVSYVVDASRPDAGAAMADYRAAGHEVVAMVPLPDGAAPKDVETSFVTYLDRMPEVVAVMDTPAAGFQSGRAIAKQVAEFLAAEGRGLITYSKGLNAATQVASRNGVPAKLVFREFDNNGQDSAAIQRFLDNAAFRAGQETGVILVGHNRPETIAALLEWGVGTRASTVALAPVSAALLSN